MGLDRGSHRGRRLVRVGCNKKFMKSQGASLLAQMVKNLPLVQESLDWEDPLEKGMVTHSSIHAWRIPWTEEPGGLLPIDSRRVGHNSSDSHRHT